MNANERESDACGFGKLVSDEFIRISPTEYSHKTQDWRPFAFIRGFLFPSLIALALPPESLA
jgi:hypothetical protein